MISGRPARIGAGAAAGTAGQGGHRPSFRAAAGPPAAWDLWPVGAAPASRVPGDLGSIPRLEAVPCRDLDAAPLIHGGMLDESDQAARHEAAGPDGCAGAGHLAHLHHPARRDDLDAASGARGDDLEGLHALTRVDESFDSIAFHRLKDTPVGVARVSGARVKLKPTAMMGTARLPSA